MRTSRALVVEVVVVEDGKAVPTHDDAGGSDPWFTAAPFEWVDDSSSVNPETARDTASARIAGTGR